MNKTSGLLGGWKARREMRQARRLYELARIESMMAENQRRLDEIERRNTEGCPLCPPVEVSR